MAWVHCSRYPPGFAKERWSKRGSGEAVGGRRLLGGRPLQLVRLKSRNVRQVAVLILEVQTVAHDELIGDLEGNMVWLDGNLLALLFAKKYGRMQGPWFTLLDLGEDAFERVPGVEDIIDQEDVAALDRGKQLCVYLEGTRLRCRTPVTPCLNQSDSKWHFKKTNQIGKEDHASRQHSHHGQGPLTLVLVNFSRKSLHAGPDFGLVQDDSQGRT